MNRGEPKDFEQLEEISGYVFVEDRSGRIIGEVPGLSDAMPYALMWSPRANWFFVDHHSGSFKQQAKVFEITPDSVVEHTDFYEAAQDAYQEMFPCLRNPDWHWVNGNVQGWSSDGSRLAWIMKTRIDVCMDEGQTGPVPPHQVVHPVLLISDLDTGDVIEGSVIVIDGDEFAMPADGLYADVDGFTASAE